MENQQVSRKSFLKTAGITAAGLLWTSTLSGMGSKVFAAEAEAAQLFLPGTYTSEQTTGFATVEVTCTFSSTEMTEVSYEVTKTSDSDYFQLLDSQLRDYCDRVLAAGSTVDVDGVSGATLSTSALKDGINACIAQALGLPDPDDNVLNKQEEYDTYTTDYAAIFEPIQVGSMTLRNRIVKSAGSSPWGQAENAIQPSAIDLYGRMADGGVALIVLTSSTIRSYGFNPDTVNEVENPEEGIAIAKEFFDMLHEKGACVGYQMSLGGPTGESKVNEYTVEELQTWVQGVATCASRLKEAGIDCIEIKGATCDGLNAFLTRRQNQREDEYGPQSIENRTRLFADIIRAIKEACGEDFTVLTLINALEENDSALGQNDQYLTIEETKEIAKALESAGADLIQVRVGTPGQEISCWAPDCNHAILGADGATGFGTQFDYSTHFEGLMDGSHSGVGSFIPLAKQIREAVSIPVGCAGDMDPRLAPDLINQAVANGDVDLVFLNRPLNVDPELPIKLQEGRRDEVMPCTHCLHCHDSVASDGNVRSSCRVNATSRNAYTDTMPEGSTPTPAEQARNVMVIGGGPAGMEAARIAASRGHNVTLYEASDKLGGLLPFAAGVKGSHEHLEDLRQYLSHQLELTGVTVNLLTSVDADLVAESAPDAVIVAVGGSRETRWESTGQVTVMDIEQAFGKDVGENVILLGAGVQAIDYASWLLNKGVHVQIVHEGTFDEVDKEQSVWFQNFTKAHLCANGVKFWNGAAVSSIEEDGILITTDFGAEKKLTCDTVIECYDMQPNTDLAEELKAAGYEVYTVGDCASPYNIQKAILSGNLAGRAVV